MNVNMTPISIGVAEKYRYFMSKNYKFIETGKIEDETL